MTKYPSPNEFRSTNDERGPHRFGRLFLGPFGLLVGLNGVILLAYVVAIPANEIVIPTILMLTVLTTGATGTNVNDLKLLITLQIPL